MARAPEKVYRFRHGWIPVGPNAGKKKRVGRRESRQLDSELHKLLSQDVPKALHHTASAAKTGYKVAKKGARGAKKGAQGAAKGARVVRGGYRVVRGGVQGAQEARRAEVADRWLRDMKRAN